MIIHMMISNRYITQGITDISVDSLNKLERIYWKKKLMGNVSGIHQLLVYADNVN